MEEIKIEKLEFYILKILKQLKTELYLNTSNVKVKVAHNFFSLACL